MGGLEFISNLLYPLPGAKGIWIMRGSLDFFVFSQPRTGMDIKSFIGGGILMASKE